jgi:hypothetical protein
MIRPTSKPDVKRIAEKAKSGVEISPFNTVLP